MMLTPGFSTSTLMVPNVSGTCVSGTNIFASISVAGGHGRTGDVSHAAGHYRKQLALRQTRQKRPNSQRRLGLSHKDAGRNIGRFRAAGGENFLHQDRHAAHEDLHDAEVVKNRKKGGDEDDDGQNLKRENHAKLIVLRTQFFAEEELASFHRVSEHVIHGIARGLEQVPDVGAQNEKREAELEAESPEQDAGFNGAAIRREQVSD
jgi:hypothetical protein